MCSARRKQGGLSNPWRITGAHDVPFRQRWHEDAEHPICGRQRRYVRHLHRVPWEVLVSSDKRPEPKSHNCKAHGSTLRTVRTPSRVRCTPLSRTHGIPGTATLTASFQAARLPSPMHGPVVPSQGVSLFNPAGLSFSRHDGVGPPLWSRWTSQSAYIRPGCASGMPGCSPLAIVVPRTCGQAKAVRIMASDRPRMGPVQRGRETLEEEAGT